MARTVSIIAVICGIALFFAALSVFKFGDVEALLFALGVMVALVPEGLPATLSSRPGHRRAAHGQRERPHQEADRASRRWAPPT